MRTSVRSPVFSGMAAVSACKSEDADDDDRGGGRCGGSRRGRLVQLDSSSFSSWGPFEYGGGRSAGSVTRPWSMLCCSSRSAVTVLSAARECVRERLKY